MARYFFLEYRAIPLRSGMSVYAGQYGPEGLEFPDGAHAVNTPVEIRTLGGSLVTLYADRNRSAILANPVNTDYLGNITFWANPGKYAMKYQDLSLTISVPEDPLEPDESITPEDRAELIEDAVTATLEELETPVTLTILFSNALSH